MGKTHKNCGADAKHHASHLAKQRRDAKAANNDEFEYMDDPHAELAYAADPMRDSIHDEQAKSILRTRALSAIAGAPQIAPSEFTCFNCKSGEHCAFYMDTYNLNGDCLMLK